MSVALLVWCSGLVLFVGASGCPFLCVARWELESRSCSCLFFLTRPSRDIITNSIAQHMNNNADTIKGPLIGSERGVHQLSRFGHPNKSRKFCLLHRR
jgi:hypothetical protein